jgi:hypothetical protein
VGEQEALSEPHPVADRSPDRSRDPEVTLPRWVFLAVAVAAAAVLVTLSRGVFLFWDDFVFLGEARESNLSRSYLADPLFRHFSPVVRLVNLLVVGSIPDHPWVIPLVQFVLLTLVASSVVWLMVVLHGRTAPALVGSVLLAPSLTLLQLGNWWTAGINLMPALIAFYVSFGAMVQVLRGRSRLYAVPCLAGAAIGVLDYELPMLLCGYLGLWFLLFGSRVTSETVVATLRRTWWLWVGVTAIGVAAALNYRLNYYDPVQRPSPVDVVHAMGRSLVRTLIPTALGFHDPRSAGFSALSLVIGCVGLVLLVSWLLATRRGAWRGLVFAGAGWLLPTLALVLNRVSIFGVGVVDNAIYFHLPSVLFVVGVLEAWLAPRRQERSRAGAAGPARRLVVPTALLVVVGGYAWSAGPTADYQLPEGATPTFVQRARASAATLVATGEPFSVVNSDVPGFVVPGDFEPYNRADRVLGVTVPALTFDDPSVPLYRLAAGGDLVPVEVDWLDEATPSVLTVRDGPDDATTGDDGLCFTAGATTSVVWSLDASQTGPDLVVRTVATVAATTTLRLVVRPEGKVGFDRANKDRHTLTPDRSSVLDTVATSSAATLRLKGFTPGIRVCIESVAVGRVTAAS